MPASTAELLAAATIARGPTIVPAGKVNVGGVDPLGLRQINFDLMDLVIPDINNVVRHIRPFIVVTWAWRRAIQLSEKTGKLSIKAELLRDFVDRVEVIYAWSQFVRDPDADLPGRRALARILNLEKFTFGGETWSKQKKVRRYSTGFSSPINYGPALKSLGWVAPNPKDGNILVPQEVATDALDSFEHVISDRMKSPAFAKLGEVTIKRTDVVDWADAWALENPTKAERLFAWETLVGSHAPRRRRSGIELAIKAAEYAKSTEVPLVNRAMAGHPSSFVPPGSLSDTAAKWRNVQLRQLFRLSLEAGLHWITNELRFGSRPSSILARRFISQCAKRHPGHTALRWLMSGRPRGNGPIELMEALEASLADDGLMGLASCVADGLAYVMAEGTSSLEPFEQHDRLPIARAKAEADSFKDRTPEEFMVFVIETWILAQHTYWSIGRGLADARAGGKKLLRLRVMMEEGGWTLLPYVRTDRPPNRTPDRLETALSLARECRRLPVAKS